MVFGLNIFLLLPPSQLLLVLPLLLLLEVVLKRADLVDQLGLVRLVRSHVLLYGHAGLDYVLLKLHTLRLTILVVIACIVHVGQVIVDDGALVVQRRDRRLQPLNFNLFLRDLHGHLVLLVIEHVFVVGGGHWRSLLLLFFGAFGWGAGLGSAGHCVSVWMFIEILINKVKLILF